jgi:hypothetical protein
MPKAEDIKWFKKQFHTEIEKAVAGTPFDLDLLTALACQETGYIWQTLRKKTGFSTRKILALCVGDTLDSNKGRRAFPRTKGDLVAAKNGQAMFEIARQALIDLAVHIPGFKGAARNSSKFCHGFGIWQYDLQFFKVDPDYFLKKRYEDLNGTLDKAVEELKSAQKRAGYGKKRTLTDLEMAHVAIAYNAGRFIPKRGLKQGHWDSSGRYYGELIFDYLRSSRTVPTPGGAPEISPPPVGNAIVPPPTPVEASGEMLIVDTRESPLRLRSEPKISRPSGANVIGHLPDGHPVRAVTGRASRGFREVETDLAGANLRGFAFAEFLKPAPSATKIPTTIPEELPPPTGVIAVTMPRKAGTVTKRTGIADAHSLNEKELPGRKGTTPADLIAELDAIIDWLAVDKTSHKRYKPRSGLTFCNIYTHDFCHLAGAYLPRVWWTQKAVIDLTTGKAVRPLIGNTIFEMRANDLFRWLRDFGPAFGWRQTGTLSKLQQNANQGGLGLIVARRKIEGRSGHIVMVVPESSVRKARRNTAGEVIAPVQSQAGSRNFRRSTGGLNWWRHDRFAESAFWIHS